MRYELDVKVSGGKLIRVRIDADGGRASRVAVDGDFFAHPEELFEEAEAELSGIGLAELGEEARRAFSRPGLVIFGAGAEDIAGALEGAVRGH